MTRIHLALFACVVALSSRAAHADAGSTSVRARSNERTGHVLLQLKNKGGTFSYHSTLSTAHAHSDRGETGNVVYDPMTGKTAVSARVVIKEDMYSGGKQSWVTRRFTGSLEPRLEPSEVVTKLRLDSPETWHLQVAQSRALGNLQLVSEVPHDARAAEHLVVRARNDAAHEAFERQQAPIRAEQWRRQAEAERAASRPQPLTKRIGAFFRL